MSSDMYSTNPTIFGSGAIVAATFMGGDLAAAQATAAAPYVAAGIGLLLLAVALGVTGSMGSEPGMLRFCSIVGAIACAVAAWRLWATVYQPLALTCAVAAPVLIAWGWGHAWWLTARAKRKA